MKKLLLSLSAFVFACLNCFTQDSYFQQKVDTYIEVRLDDKKHSLIAFEKITYTNNSPDNLDSIVFHLWPNAYKNVNTELAKHDVENGETEIHFAPNEQRGFIDSLKFTNAGESLKWHYYKKNIDIAIVHLKIPLKPGETIEITTPFYVKLPLGIFSRLGHIEQSYQVTQWFPKPAVYDENGWHPLPYLSQGEFYSEFGSYDVKITLPENYIVGATGDLVNGEDELEFLLNKVKETESLFNNNLLPLLDSLGKKDLSFPLSSSKFKTLHFHQENVHDFAWFADKRYHVLKGEVELPKSKKKVNTWAMFTNNEAKLWENSIEYINDATYYYSLWVGEYPYKHVTAVDGSISAGGGMEYPNITVIGESFSHKAHEEVIVHEVGHNWFYGILGNNERTNAWMDEGMNTFLEYRHLENKYSDTNSYSSSGLNSLKRLNQKDMLNLGYQFNAKRNLDQPIQMGASLYTYINYGAIVYGKTGIGFNYLKAYLGDELFDKCMHAYFDKWKFKHPQPEDLEMTFENISGKNLNWFFQDFIKTTKKIDYKIKRIKKDSSNNYQIKLTNLTELNSPISIAGISSNRSVTPINKIWIPGFYNDTIINIKANDYISHFILDIDKESTDINASNNVIKTKGLFKKTEPIKLKLLAGIDNPNESTIYFSPILGWNAYDKLMPGMAFYNSLIFERRLEWLVAPMFSIGNKFLNGTAKINYRFYPDKTASKITIGYKVSSYFQGFDYGEAYKRWIKNEIRTDIRFKEKSIRSSPLHQMSLKGVRIDDHIPSGNFILPPETEHQLAYYGVMDYTIKNKQFLTPKSLTLRYLFGHNTTEPIVNTISITGHYRLNYNKRLKGIELRLFAGYNLYSNNIRYNFFIRGQDGYSDYLYERTYLGRNKTYPNTLAQQTSSSHGAFKINTFTGTSDTWLISCNTKLELPRTPLGVFADLGAFPSILIQNGNPQDKFNLLYNAGIYLALKANNDEIMGIYIPLLFSKDIGNSIIDNQYGKTINDLNLLQRITFVLNIENINPFKIVKSIAP